LELLAAAQKMISIDSSPANGTVEIVRFVQELATKMGLKTQVLEETSNGVPQANIFIKPGELSQRLLLQTHLDTTDPGSFALWTKTGFNPYQSSIRGDKVYGLGAADVKLDFLCKLYAMKRTTWSQMKNGVVLLGTFGEEDRMRGAVKAVRERLVQASLALIGEPTDLNVVYAGKGIAHMEINIPFDNIEKDWEQEEVTGSTQSKIFQGRAGHSSQPELGENAIVKMLDYLNRLPDSLQVLNVDGGITFNTIPTQAALEFDLNAQHLDEKPQRLRKIYKTIKNLEIKLKSFPSDEFDPPYPTINIGKIRTFQDHFGISGAVRWNSHISEDQYQSWMDEISKSCSEQKSEFRILDVKKPFQTDKDTAFVKLCLQEAQKIRKGAELKTQAVTNEANVFSRFGFQCLVFGPGQRQNAHTPEEHVVISDLTKAEDFYYNVIQQVCL
jgi:acetylornithine deacetylase/succinyl-diaminopimelate desuccinylase-like protein